MHFYRQLRLNASLSPVLDWIDITFRINDVNTNINNKLAKYIQKEQNNDNYQTTTYILCSWSV